jgi:hypothetical protein
LPHEGDNATSEFSCQLRRPLIGLEHNPKPSVSETMRNLPGWHSDEPGPCQGRTDQRIEVIGAKPGWNAQRSSHRAVLEAPFRHAWYIAEGQAVMLDQVVRRRRLAAPTRIAANLSMGALSRKTGRCLAKSPDTHQSRESLCVRRWMTEQRSEP